MQNSQSLCDHPSPTKWLPTSPSKEIRSGYSRQNENWRRARRGYAKHLSDRRKEKAMWLLARKLVSNRHSTAELVDQAYIEHRFHQLADEWSSEVMNVSSLTALTTHRNYQEIIKLGWNVVPYLLMDLQKSNTFWFPALSEITKVQPFDARDAGNSKRMAKAWIEWGKKKRIIS